MASSLSVSVFICLYLLQCRSKADSGTHFDALIYGPLLSVVAHTGLKGPPQCITLAHQQYLVHNILMSRLLTNFEPG